MVLSELGDIYVSQGDYVKAREYYEIAAELTPRDYRVWTNLADAESQISGQEKSARSHYADALDLATELLEINPENADVLSLLAWCAANIELEALAERSINDAIRIAPEDPNIIYISIIMIQHLSKSYMNGIKNGWIKLLGFIRMVWWIKV